MGLTVIFAAGYVWNIQVSWSLYCHTGCTDFICSRYFYLSDYKICIRSHIHLAFIVLWNICYSFGSLLTLNCT